MAACAPRSADLYVIKKTCSGSERSSGLLSMGKNKAVSCSLHRPVKVVAWLRPTLTNSGIRGW